MGSDESNPPVGRKAQRFLNEAEAVALMELSGTAALHELLLAPDPPPFYVCPFGVRRRFFFPHDGLVAWGLARIAKLPPSTGEVTR